MAVLGDLVGRTSEELPRDPVPRTYQELPRTSCLVVLAYLNEIAMAYPRKGSILDDQGKPRAGPQKSRAKPWGSKVKHAIYFGGLARTNTAYQHPPKYL